MKKLVLSLVMLLVGWTAPAALSAEADLNACYYGICTGDIVLNMERNYRHTQVLGITPFGKFTLRFLDTGAIGGNWDYFDLAKTVGCNGPFCVGTRVQVIPRNYRVAQVIGLQYNGMLALRFEDTGGKGRNWTPQQLIRITNGPVPTPVCPPGTHWDPVLARCVSNTPPPPPPHLYTCRIHHFVASDYSIGVARQRVLQQCALSSGGYVCQGSMVQCQ